MELLPKFHQDFASKSYWDEFFKKRKETFEWYGEYSDLCGVLHSYSKTNENILVAGCGNSKLSEDLYDVGYKNITNIDISDLVIKQMNKRNQNRRSKMRFLKMDVKETDFDDEQFSVVIDKGTLDALFAENNNENVKEVHRMFDEFNRILKCGGRYICITLAQSHILEHLLNYFPSYWIIRVHLLEIKNDNQDGLGSKLPVFAFIFTKMKLKLVKPVLELITTEGNEVQKYECVTEIKRNISEFQGYAFIQDKLGKSNLGNDVVTVDLWSKKDKLKEPRYSLKVLDIKKADLSIFNGVFAVFIVPQGQEMETTFSTDDGLRKLGEMAGFSRLAVATLHRGHVYLDLEEIKADLSEKVMELAPSGMSKNVKVPFLTSSSELGNRDIVHEGVSAIHGEYVVEDIKSPDDYYYRQLILLDSLEVAQSQVRLTIDRSSKRNIKKKKRIPDHRRLMKPCDKAKLVGFSLLENFSVDEKLNLFIHGFRNNCFISFLLELFPKIHVTYVEEDSEMIDVATKWFKLPESNERLEIAIGNPFNFLLHENHRERYDMIILEELTDECLQKNMSSLKSALKESGVLSIHYINIRTDSEYDDEYGKTFSWIFSSQVEDATQIMYYVLKNDKSRDDDVVYRTQMQNIHKCIYEQKKDFYDKAEWDILVDYVDDLFKISE